MSFSPENYIVYYYYARGPKISTVTSFEAGACKFNNNIICERTRMGLGGEEVFGPLSKPGYFLIRLIRFQ